jgi:hypothetical protein
MKIFNDWLDMIRIYPKRAAQEISAAAIIFVIFVILAWWR